MNSPLEPNSPPPGTSGSKVILKVFIKEEPVNKTIVVGTLSANISTQVQYSAQIF